MTFIKDIDQIRNIDWAQQHLFDVKFEDTPVKEPKIPGKFVDWFPAAEIKENIYALDSHTFEGGQSTYKVPKLTKPFDIEVTFPDDIFHGIQGWLSKWVNEVILNNGMYLTPLTRCCKTIHIAKLDREGEVLKDDDGHAHIDSYLVYPEGEGHFVGNSDSEIHMNVVTFIVAAKL